MLEWVGQKEGRRQGDKEGVIEGWRLMRERERESESEFLEAQSWERSGF